MISHRPATRKKPIHNLLSILFAVALCLASTRAHAVATDWQGDEAVGVRLIAGLDGVGTEKNIPLGLEVQLAPEWHTYWRSPGMAGLPPQIDWHASENETGNLQSADLYFPAPHRYTAYGLETIGYENHVIFPIDAQLLTAGKPLDIDASLNLLVCSAICVPKTFVFKLIIPEGTASPSAEAPLLKQALLGIPDSPERSGFILKDVTNHGDTISFVYLSRAPLDLPDLFVENDDVSFAAPTIEVDALRHEAHFSVQPVDTLEDGKTLAGMKLTVTLVDGDRALEQKMSVPPAITTEPKIAATKAAAVRPSVSFGVAILLALLGGFILNLMPCVLPVLSMKVLSVVSHGGRKKRLVRHSFIITAFGIIFSYLVLGIATIALKKLGLTFGWGLQFQQPMFLVVLVMLLTFFAANMWGLLEIQLPRWIADNLDPLYHPKLAGDFLTGAFATLLSTPCSAPFLGTAVSFALAAGSFEILIIFFSLGVGMSVPYLAVALWPRLATALPKPGMWMLRLRYLLGGALGLTAFWLVWILMAQIPVRFAVLIGLCMAGIVILLALAKTSVSKRLIRFGLVDFVVVALLVTLAGSLLPKEKSDVDRLWTPLNEATIAADVAEGQTVFVDVTADWCLTCKANMRFVLTRGDVAQRLLHSDVIAMQGDWTNPDPAIADFLHKYGRYGIPFNIVFGPAAPEGIVLPELLTRQDVLDGLEKAKSQSIERRAPSR